MSDELTSLEQLLDRADKAAHQERVSLGAILQEVGRRSFGTLLLVAGLVSVAPVIGAIPGVPTVMAVMVLLTAGQLLFRREYFWLPGWLLRRTMSRDKLCKALIWLRPPARFFDRLSRPRLTLFVQGAGIYAIAILSIATAVLMPLMELVPFSGNIAGIVLTAFGLALIAHDGFLALFGHLVIAITWGFVVYKLL